MTPKFRAWDEENKKMLVVNDICNLFWENTFLECYELVPDPKGKREYELINHRIDFEDCVLMQSTGLFDKNGKEIFEGDIFTYLDDDNDPIYENIVVKFGQHTNMNTIFERKPVYIGLYAEVQKGTATLDVDIMYNDCEGRLTIVGNIYENPELVEVNND